MYNPPHPGPAIREAIEALSMTVTEFADHIGVSRVTLSRVLNARSGVTPEMSLRISEAFGQGSSDIWFKMQNAYDFWQAVQTKRKKVSPVSQKAA
jgi:addiction module HigA family antidote